MGPVEGQPFTARKVAGALRVACYLRPISAVATVWLWFLLLIAAKAGAEDRLAVSLSREISSHWFRGSAGGNAVPAAPGEVVVLGELSLPGDAPSQTSGFRLRRADETACPLHIDQSTVVREFGKIVFFRFSVTLPARLAEQGGLVMQWGDDLRCPNILVPAIRADPARRADYREIVFSPAAGASPATEERQLDLKVVVDRQSSRYRLLYLLPIVLVLAAAMVRARFKRPPSPPDPLPSCRVRQAGEGSFGGRCEP
jgi:hypothetical protein